MYKCLGTNKLDFTTQFHPRDRLKDTCIYSMYVLNKPIVMHIFPFSFLHFPMVHTHPPHPIICSSISFENRKMVNIISITTRESKAKVDESSNSSISRTTFSLVILYQQLSNRNKELNHLKTSSRNKIYLSQASVSLS